MKKRWSNSSKVPVFSGSLLRKRLARFFPSRSIIERTFSGQTVLLALSLSASIIGADVRRIELVDGDIYEGDVKDGVRTGQGRLERRGGAWYQGDFLDGQMHGKGTYSWADRRVYQGAFRNDKRHGSGTLRWPNGDQYVGDFLDNRRTGAGRFVSAENDVYEGEFLNDQRHGNGGYVWSDGRRYEGMFRDGVKSGMGVLTWPTGNKYEGQFLEDQRHGLGVLYWGDGTTYQGLFALNQMNGYGVKTIPNEVPVFQQWRMGDLLEAWPIVENDRCRLNIDDAPWIFSGGSCINGQAHGTGIAVSVDGQAYIVNGRFVLGRLIQGDVKTLPLPESQ